MKLEDVLEGVRPYRDIAARIPRLAESEYQEAKKASSSEIEAFLNLMNMPVSSVSIFKDPKWSFPEVRSKEAKTLSVTRFEVDFGSYSSIPAAILVQAKIAFLVLTKLPRVALSKSRRGKGAAVKIQTLSLSFRAFLTYVNHVFSKMADQFGSDVVADNFQSLEDLKRSHYVEYSESYSVSKNVAGQVESVFAYLQNKHLHDILFSGSIATPKIEQTKASLSETQKDDREKVLDDLVFEKATALSGYIVTDFLRKLGVEVRDRKSLDLMRNFPFDIQCKLVDIDWEILDTYALIRLTSKGWPYDEAVEVSAASRVLSRARNSTDLRKSLRSYLAETNPDLENLDGIREYMNLVYRAGFFIIAQFTGMRPNELMEVKLDAPLEDSFGVSCLVSKVRKHQNSERALFDDLWVCTPAMLDALEALKIIARLKANPFFLSSADTVCFGNSPKPLSQKGVSHVLFHYLKQIIPGEFEESDIFPYVLRHTLAYQLFKADLGLPFISHQLKHFGNLVEAFGSASNRGFSDVTLGYGEIGERLSGSSQKGQNLRQKAEVQAVKSAYDPDANYAGINGKEHTERMRKVFAGYLAAGYTKDEIYLAMARQGIAIANVGTGMCYGGKAEDFDESLPCIGGLRCNPVRCSNAVITEAHIPKWREVYTENMRVVEQGEAGPGFEQAQEAANEAKMVLVSLGEAV
jgi:integrase